MKISDTSLVSCVVLVQIENMTISCTFLFPYLIVCNTSNTGASSKAGTIYIHRSTWVLPLVFSEVAQHLVLYVVLCRSLFVGVFSFFFWPLYFLAFDLRLLISRLVSWNSSALEGYVVPVPLETPIILLLLQTRWSWMRKERECDYDKR